MEKTFKDRLHALMGSKSGRKFAEHCGVQDSTMRGYLLGKYEPTIENLKKIARACNVTVGWLADGEGEESEVPQMSFAHLPNRDANPKFDDYIGKTARVITSKTIYRSALERNIDAFHKAVETEDEMQGVREKLEVMQVKHDRDMEELKRLILNQGNQQKRDSAANA